MDPVIDLIKKYCHLKEPQNISVVIGPWSGMQEQVSQMAELQRQRLAVQNA